MCEACAHTVKPGTVLCTNRVAHIHRECIIMHFMKRLINSTISVSEQVEAVAQKSIVEVQGDMLQ